MNPYAQDAVVDITIITNDTMRRPSELQSFVVPARSRRSVFVNDAADRKRIVSVVVESPQGNHVIAQQTVVHRGSGRRFGVSSTIGAVTPVRRATFSGGNARSDGTRLMYVMNPGRVSTDVDILVTARGVAPTTITIEPESVVVVNVNEIVPLDTKYALIVEATAGFGGSPDTGRGVIVDDFEGYRIDGTRRTVFGVAGGVGTTSPAAEWRFAVSQLGDDSLGQIEIYNPNGDAVVVDVAYVSGGEIVRPRELQNIEIDGSTQRDVRIDPFIDEQAGMIITASDAIYVERRLVRDEGVTRAAGVPRRG